MKSTDYEAIQPDLFYATPSGTVVPATATQTGKACAAFTRQELAFEYFDKLRWYQRRNCKLYSFESLHSGKRMFLVAEYNKFCLDYFKTAEYRHVYEIIRDGFPCRLYFDLEYPTNQNPHVDGDALTKKWIKLVVDKVYALHKDICSHQVIVLDSCTPEKYSKHITIRLFNQSTSIFNKSEHMELLLPDNLEIGYIMNQLLMDITSSYEYTSSSFTAPIRSEAEATENDSSPVVTTPSIVFEVKGRRRTPLPEHLDLFVLNKDGTKRTCFVDLGVYTRNRAFRLFYSTKYGKTKRLEVKSSDVRSYGMRLEDSSASSGDLTSIRRDWLSQSLVIPYDLFNGPPKADECDTAAVDPDSRKRKLDNDVELTQPVSPGGSAIGATPNETSSPASYLTSSLNSDRYIVLPSLNPEANTSGVLAKDRSPTFNRYPGTGSGGGGPWRSNEIARSTHNREPSWFPALDEYVTVHCASMGGVKGAINGWSLTASTSSASDATFDGPSFTFYRLKYQVLYNRYCGNVQRQHKSNGIMLEVDLIQKTVVQSCWDAECRGYKSPPVYLPEGLIPEVTELQSRVLDYQINQAIRQRPDEWQALL